LRPLEANVGGQFESIRPVGLPWRAQHAADLLQLVVLTLAGEERAQVVEFGHDAAHGENVHRRVVGVGAQQQLGRALPARGHLVRLGRLGADLARQPHVRHLDQLILGGQQVLRLQVAVEEPLVVHEAQPLEHLEHDVADCALAELLGPVLHQLLHIVVNLFKYHVQFILGADDFF